jgi:hypothetical protein
MRQRGKLAVKKNVEVEFGMARNYTKAQNRQLSLCVKAEYLGHLSHSDLTIFKITLEEDPR